VYYRIVKARKEHLPFLGHIELAAADLFSNDDIPETLRAGVVPGSAFIAPLSNDMLWVAVDEMELPVGFLLAEVVDSHFHIHEMDVHPSHGRKGIGTKLLQHACRIAKERGFLAVTLTTFSHVRWNAPFYSKVGFIPCSESDIGDGLAAKLKEERAKGFKNRIAMIAHLK
jgi:GNAT superfamily N-acetyltransferase